MEIIFAPQALEDRDFWKRSGNIAVMKRIDSLLTDIQQHPYSGIGKPEALKYNLAGKWSRRINPVHRIVYRVDASRRQVVILSMRFHYN